MVTFEKSKNANHLKSREKEMAGLKKRARNAKKKSKGSLGRLGRSSKRWAKRHHLGRKALDYGVPVAAAGLAAGGIGASLLTGNPIPLAAGAAGGAALQSFADDMRRGHRNSKAMDAAARPTGSKN